MKKITLLFIISLNCLSGQNFSQQSSSLEEKLTFHLLDVEMGLSSNWIHSIEQDSLGFIWVATPEGLNRYDGTKFTVYKREGSGTNKKLNDDYINQIKRGKNGTLLLAMPKGLNIYDLKTDSFMVKNIEDGLIGNNISRLEYGNGNQIFLGIYHEGVQIIDEKGHSTVFTHNINNNNSLSSNEIISMELEGDSLLWVGTKNYGLNKINYRTKQVTRIALKKNNEPLDIRAIYYGENNNLWIGSNKGIYVVTKEKDTLHIPESTIKGQGLSDGNVLCFEEDNLGQLWIGTENGGLNILNKFSFLQKNANFSIKWFLPEDDGSSVYNRTVSALKKDLDGNMWVGTSTGLNFVNPEGETITLLKKNSYDGNGLAHNRIAALAESYNRKIWIGTDGAGLELYNPINDKFKHYQHNPNDENGLSSNYVISVLEDSKQRLWVGTYQVGINKLNPVNGNFKHYLKGDSENGSDVRVIFEDRGSNIWVGTNRGGLFKYDEPNDNFKYIASLGKLDIRGISEDSHGSLWMATYGNGILRYEPSQDRSTFYTMENTQGIMSNSIVSILALPNNDILAGTENEGLIRLNPSNNLVSNYRVKDGISNNTIGIIVMEDQKNIWLGTDKGISNYNAVTNEIYNLNSYTNIQQGKFNIGAGTLTRSGIIYFGGEKGLNIFNPDKIKNKREAHPIVFTTLDILANKNKNSRNYKEASNETMFYSDAITLKHNETPFTIDYVTLKYPFTKNTNYFYKVDGYNDQWISTDESGKVNLINMPPGNYTLNVKARFGSGNEVIKSIPLKIKPPIWRTPLAFLFYIIFSITIIYWFMRYYAERIKLMNSLSFEKKQRQLEYNLNEERLRFFTSFSHELKTPLTLILAPLEDLIAQVKSTKQKNSLELIQKNAKTLLLSINKLLEFRKSNLGLSKLRIERHNLTECLEQWIHNYFPLARKRNIALTYELPEESLLAWFDLDKMHIIFNNLVSNAFKYTQDNGKVNIMLQYDEEQFKIMVRDTGYGIEKEELENIFERFYQSNTVKVKDSIGIGLALSKNFAELHMGSILIESEVNKGSTFSVVIPRDSTVFKDAVIDKSVYNENADIDDMEHWTAVPKLDATKEVISNLNTDKEKELLLLIDDNPDILSYLDGLLEGKYDLIYAKNGEEGVEKAKKYIPDLIVSDVMMPKMNGIQLCNVLKETIETTHIPIILLTAKSNDESITEGFEHGADDYIVKPFSSKILQTRIKNLLDSRKQLRDYFLKKNDIDVASLNKSPSLLDQEKDFLSKLEKIILDNLDQENLDVWSVSESIGMSRTSLYRKIKAITGLNINQFIRKVKIDKAERLLKTGNYTISQASYEVGFNNIKYFRKLFKEQFGCLPSDVT